MEIIYLPEADKDLNYWIRVGDKAILRKISEITKSIIESPYKGIGKPEALKHHLAPKWSRRITKEHRYVYLIHNEKLYVYSLRGHY